MARTTVEVIPSAKRLIRSLRDVGYDFVHAVADIVDNSIAAKAGEVAIDMRFNGEDSWLRIADNGCGMSGTIITEAMRFGSERDYETDDLGKFGLGLKTASLSQCSKLTVASRYDRDARRIEVRQWDLAHVESTNKWEIINLPADERPEHLTAPLQEHAGTVVLWEKLDRVLGYKIPWGDKARSGFLRMAEQLDEHLAMVFHRFLSGEARRKKGLKITINGTVVEPWDPFAREEKATIRLTRKQFEVQTDNGLGLVGYTAFILPHQHAFSSPKAFERHSGPSKWNYQQGFYIYRSDRMIQSGGWSHMRTSDEHTKLARVALEFLPDLDSAFELNVSKARVNLPSGLRSQVKPLVEELAKQARKVYGSGPKVPGKPVSVGVGRQPPAQPGAGTGPVAGSGNGQQPSAGTGTSGGNVAAPVLPVIIGRALDSAAVQAGETAALTKIKRVLKQSHPEIAHDIGW